MVLNTYIEKPEPYDPEQKSSGDEKKKPLAEDWISLGEGQGIRVTVWNRSVNLQRRVKQDDGTWQVEQEIALAKPALERLFISIPRYYALMRK